MEATSGSVTVTLTNGLLMCAGEVLTTLLVSALFKPNSSRLWVPAFSLVSVCVFSFSLEEEGGDGLGEGEEEELSSEDGEVTGNDPNNNKK
ncbi:hypothetical protein H0E87_014244 [Populus deltoides]|uniref:Uncharacterized protein n=1 Tax=Populus deltoides TaxID=3696 RepID=A0A8T2YCK2_POPDE|nr:hypothetical protein H0E87_014244 [Populus deltoides]